MKDSVRDEIAAILETIARDGLPHPRDLDVALDAIVQHVEFPIQQTLKAIMKKRGGPCAASANVMAQQQARDEAYKDAHDMITQAITDPEEHNDHGNPTELMRD